MYASGSHFMHHLPGNILGQELIGEARHQKQGRIQSQLLQDGKGILIIVPISVIEGQDDRLRGEWCFVGNRQRKIVQINGLVPILRQI